MAKTKIYKKNSIDRFIKKTNRVKSEGRILFHFHKHWDKLDTDKFTTIRSTKYAQEHDIEIGDVGWISVDMNSNFKKVRVVSWSDMAINMIPMDLLKKDIAPDIVNSYEEFAQNLNAITIASGKPYANNRVTTVKRIFVVEAVH